MRIEAIEAIRGREVRGGVRPSVPSISLTETRRSFASQVADVLLRGVNGLLGSVVVVIWLDIGEGLGKGTEWAARRVNGNYRRYMEELKNGHAPRDLE